MGSQGGWGRHRGDRGSQCQGSLSPELWNIARTPSPSCTGPRHHGSHPSQLQRGEGRGEGGPPREEQAQPCHTKEAASSREPGLGGGGASGMAAGRAANAYLEAEASRTPAVQHASPSPAVTEGTRTSPASQTCCCAHCKHPLPDALPAPSTPAQRPRPPTLVCSHETGMSHNSHHQLPFTCCGLASLSCFPSPKFGSAGVRRNLSSYSLRRAPERCHSSQGLPYKFYYQKSLKTTKENQFNPSKTSHIKSWQCTMLLCLPHFLSSTQGCCQHPLQTEAAVYCGIKPGCQEVAAPSATLRSLDNPLLPFFL